MTQEVRNPEVEITLKNKKHKIGLPNIGQYLRIEGLKQVLTDGRYAIMAYGGLNSAVKALDIVDGIAYYSVLIGGSFLKSFKVKDAESMMNLPMADADELIRSYQREYAPFYNKHQKRSDRPIQEPEKEIK